MPKFTSIDESATPKKAVGSVADIKMQREYEGYVSTVPTGKNGKVELDESERVPHIMRGIKLRLVRAGDRINKDVEVWSDDANIYFSVGAKGTKVRRAPKATTPATTAPVAAVGNGNPPVAAPTGGPAVAPVGAR